MRDSITPSLSSLLIDEMVRAALIEDLGRAGDVTTNAVVPSEMKTVARLVARQPGIIAGIDFATAAFRFIAPAIECEIHKSDGDALEFGDAIATLRGSARGILTAERVALNFLSYGSGIATLTDAMVERVAHTKARIAATRKTLPGFRAFAKYAVQIGGGLPHRYGLDDAILIKDNHIALVGDVALAVQRARAAAGHLLKIEIEIDRLDQIEPALAAGVDVLLLDNMASATLCVAVAMIAGRAVIEASGGITLDTVAAIAETGVDIISSGAITHSAPSLDIALDMESQV